MKAPPTVLIGPPVATEMIVGAAYESGVVAKVADACPPTARVTKSVLPTPGVIVQ